MISMENCYIREANCYITNVNCYLTNANCYPTNTNCYLTNANCYPTNTKCYLTNVNCYLTKAKCYLTNANWYIPKVNWYLPKANTNCLISVRKYRSVKNSITSPAGILLRMHPYAMPVLCAHILSTERKSLSGLNKPQNNAYLIKN